MLRQLLARLGFSAHCRRSRDAQTEPRLRAAFRHAADAILLLDEAARIESLNAAAKAVFGYADEEMIGRPLTALLPTLFREEVEEQLAASRDTSVTTIVSAREVVGLKKSGKVFPMEWTISATSAAGGEGPGEDHPPPARGFTVILRDITLRKRAEDAIRRMNDDLEERVDQRTRQLQRERARADELLAALFPPSVLEELKTTNRFAPRRFPHVAVLFADIVDFTRYCEEQPAETVIADLERLVTRLEEICQRYGLDKIKTVGDAFLACAGLSDPHEATRRFDAFTSSPALASLKAAEEMIQAADETPPQWRLAAAVHVGPVVAGVVGATRYAFDIWGDTVNTASRLESHAAPGTILVSERAWREVADQCRGRETTVEIKGKGPMRVVRFEGFQP